MKKSLSQVQIKDADQGLIEAVFSTFDVVDKDGDVTRKGAFSEGAAVVISAYGHKSWEGALPVGKGTIHETDDGAVMRGEFFLNTTHGADAWETVKQLSASGLQEWSYSLQNVTAEPGKVDGKSVRVLTKIDVKEVSPVLVGAGVDTRTLSTKGDADSDGATLPKSAKFSEQVDGALVAVKQLVEMAVERLALRAAEGKSIAEQVEALGLIVDALDPLKTAIAAQSASQSHQTEDDVRESLRAIATLQGVTV